jgi:hypothetical protein
MQIAAYLNVLLQHLRDGVSVKITFKHFSENYQILDGALNEEHLQSGMLDNQLKIPMRPIFRYHQSIC